MLMSLVWEEDTSERPWGDKPHSSVLRMLGDKVSNTGVAKLGRAMSSLLRSLKPIFLILEIEIPLFASKTS